MGKRNKALETVATEVDALPAGSSRDAALAHLDAASSHLAAVRTWIDQAKVEADRAAETERLAHEAREADDGGRA
jgi:hypothetical protein